MPNYKPIPAYLVDSSARDVAECTLRIVSENLKIKPPALRWIVKDEFGSEWFAESINGFCAKDGLVIYIHRDCSPFEIANTVAHESRHCWQITNPKWFRVPNTNYSKGLTREQKERDCRIFEMEFWNGREKRNGSFDDIIRVLTDMQIESARALIRAASQQYAFKQRVVDAPHSSSGHYPSQVKMRLIVPSEQEMEENLLQQILNG